MIQNNNQLRYEGYLATSQLWINNEINDLHQFQLKEKTKNIEYNNSFINEKRIGKLIEYFVFHELKGIKKINLLKSNIQISSNKITIGEIDVLLNYLKRNIHLEIIFKFYLYDDKIESTEINRWIGPNRSDSLLKKINKLKNKQLPILYNKYTLPILNELGIDVNSVIQKVYFKSQLFIPYNLRNKKFNIINNQCIKGYYHKENELKILEKNTLFYIPEKLDWLVEPNKHVKWLNKDEFMNEINLKIEYKGSQLCWTSLNGDLNKIFVINWT
jgi:hypothetical protein